ncbi:TetR/AcrR family transcriptional regulator [Pelotomaculum propionicicum]|uniref:Fatty acid metabolism regulator protein n=1 Tax=Pelotomaculum propionicicum TaxID=258475 RepID=A0A4Y7RVK5_9FIRM|nr:TetR/AcrR family transcriptional regulator [Pelotomaculum propionicicum]NLI11773.1 TetR/AcrR family transcriptional regulator [Peptococcaceae bacterium]TEB12941.1 Fatty acid metabolism regulator protein [Pelotomaculum propionicicum]
MAYRKTDKVGKKLEAKLQAIMQAAQTVFAEHGYHGTSIKEIARKAGLATGTIYLYLRNKEALFAALVDEIYEMVLSKIAERRKEAQDVQGKLRASMEAAIDTLGQNRALAKVILLQTANSNQAVSEQLADLLGRLAELVEEDIKESIETSQIAPLDSRIAATAFVGTFYNVVLTWLREDSPSSLAEVIGPLVEYNLRGLGFTSPPS